MGGRGLVEPPAVMVSVKGNGRERERENGALLRWDLRGVDDRLCVCLCVCLYLPLSLPPSLSGSLSLSPL